MTSNPKHFCRVSSLAVALAIASAAPIFATEQSQPKHAGNIKERQAEQIALSKIPGGTIRSAELQVANGSHFWAVFVAKPDKKDAKEVHIDATSGKILAVQTEKPEDQAEEPSKTH
jgi:siroheme synthase (precorrin-2 oxidase/ferrochelatase)